MPPDATKTIESIRQSAMREFLQHGFAGGSLRRIAAGAGVTTGALYRHFADKDALFAALVEPVYTEFLGLYQQHADEHFAMLQRDGIASLWQSSSNSMDIFVDYIYEHYDVFKLLISASEQTPFAHFTHTLIELDVDLTQKYIQLARRLGYPVNELRRDELHIVVSAQFSAIYEFVLHDVEKADTERLLKKLSGFFQAGWQHLMMD